MFPTQDQKLSIILLIYLIKENKYKIIFIKNNARLKNYILRNKTPIYKIWQLIENRFKINNKLN